MRLVIIGTGNVAEVLGIMLFKAGHEITEVYGRNAARAYELAARLNARAVLSMQEITGDADVYLAALADTALFDLHLNLRLDHGLILHTAGSVPATVLKEIGTAYGVMYPLQTLRRNQAPTELIPFLIDGSTEDAIIQIKTLAASISSLIAPAGDEQRAKIHLAATVVNNFSNHLFSLAYAFCRSEGLPFDLLGPLIKQTAAGASDGDPAERQTGPARRHDFVTLEKHEAMLRDYPQLKELYEVFSWSIVGK